MNMRITTMILLCLLTELSIVAGQPDQLLHILRELETGRNKKVDKAQERSLGILISNPQMSLKLLNCALDILLFHDKRSVKFPQLDAHIKHIDDAISWFDMAPGFRPLLVHIICASCMPLTVTNRWYEIVAALWIESNEPEETVIAFGKPTDYGTQLANCCVHNIITNKRWIECKTINWQAPIMASRTKKRNLRRELLRAQNLVAQYNQQQDTLLSYELFCKHSMNDEWALW